MNITDRVDQVVATFQRGRNLGEQGLPLDELISKLNETEARYRSVAFEGASMATVIDRKEEWQSFLERAEKHATQIHIGLGWAIAELELDLPSTLSEIVPEMQVKVLDGYGYWNGLFRRRLTIRTQQIPKEITSEHQAGFDQGVGRAIWYIAKGNIEKASNIINHFSEDRKSNLWRGIGVASTYVGGCSDELILELKRVAGDFKSKFETGMAAAEESMQIAGI
ncbi:MAG: DUF1702 family protein [Flavobacteriales bacterium]|nr:DUF1702 family protein [Flavobacteriales bacterium]